MLDGWVDGPNANTLTQLDLRENGDLSAVLPPEVLDSVDAQPIFAAYRRYRVAAERDTLRPLDEAKLLVVGNEAVGKTSLIRYLVENEPRDPDERKTPGTAIHEKIETRTWSDEESGVALNVWDFGGQEIMHGTHRFFLTERSLYLLVLEARREDDRSVYDWLKTIRNRGGESPAIVVINKCDDDGKDLRLDETGLRQDYPAIVGFVRTSCDPNERASASIGQLRTLIASTIAIDERLKHVRDRIPRSWLRVKGEVTALARERRVLESRSFVELCEHPEGDDIDDDDVIHDVDEQRALLRLLHDLGVVVAHGLRDDAGAALREITLLDPNWLTGAIYTLLNSRAVGDQGGEFSRDDMKILLDPELYPTEWHEFILDMMQEPDIGLCFELPGERGKRYLVPEALPANEPDYEMWPEESLRFRYTYDSLARGLIPRFIVQSHRNLTDHPTRWRTGVVLGAVDCHILVRGDRDRQHIDIMVDGPANRRRSALNVVLNDLEAVHDLNPEIEPKALVPLIDEPNLNVSYQHLQILEDRYGLDHEFDPEDASRSDTVRELLEGVRRDRAQPTALDEDHMRGARLPRAKPPTPAPDEPPSSNDKADTDDKPSGGAQLDVFSSWRFFSIACGLGAVVIALIMVFVLSNESRVIFGWLVGLGILVTAFMLRMNPAFFYRRLLSYVIPAGLLTNAIGFSADLFVSSEPAKGGFRWDGSVSDWFFIAWAAVVGFLIMGDIFKNR